MRLKLTAAAAASILLVLIAAVPAQADRNFGARFTANQPGDIAIVGNTVLTCDPNGQNGSDCVAAQAGGNFANNDFDAIEIDVDSDPATENSSRATLAMPSNANVLWAGLYWFANSSDPARNTVKFQPPGQSGYTNLTSNTIGTGGSVDTSGAFYSAMAVVTNQVRAAGDGVYTVADVKPDTSLGTNDNAGWSLVVVYADATQPPRNLSVFDGLVQVSQGANATRTITVNGFTTPPSGDVSTTLGVVSQDGDLDSTGDSMTLDGASISDPLNPQQNVFNSTISTKGTDLGGRTPNYRNQLGMDVDLFNADAILGNLDTSASIKLTTGGETYLPNVVTFATELYAPVVVPSKSVENVTHPSGPAQPGDTLRYTLSYENTGQDAAAGFVVTDPIPAGATYVPGSLRVTAGPNAPASPTDASGDDIAEFVGGSNSLVRYRLGTGANATAGGNLAQGATAAVTFDVTIDSNHQEGDVIVNRASSDYRGATVGTPFLNQLGPEVRTPVSIPDMSLSKTHNPAFVSGAETTFTLVASNVGQAPSAGTVTVTDTFPSGAAGFDSISNAAGQGWNCNIAGLTLTCTRSDTLPAGQSYPPIFVDAVVHDPIAATIVNTGEVSGGGETNTNNNTATDSAGATAQADVAITKRTTTPEVDNGGTIEWILDVQNRGPSTAADVVVEDILSGSDYDQISATPTQGTCDTTVSCDLGSMVPNGTASVTIRARVLANDTTLENTATVSTTTTDPNPDNNEDESSATVTNTADVGIEKSGAPANPGIGDPYAYTLEIENFGPGTATGLVITDQLPAALDSPVVNASGWSCNSPGTGGLLQCTLASLPVGGAPDITVTGTIAASAGGTFFGNDAAVDTTSRDPNQGNNVDSTTELATPAGDLAVTKLFDSDPNVGGIQSDPVTPGTLVEAILTVVNNGPGGVVNATLSDTFPAGLDVTAVDSGCVESPVNTITCDFGNLAVDDTVTVTVTALVTSVGNETLENTVNVTSDTDDPVPSNNTDRARLTVTPSANVSLTKVADPTAASVGDNVTYTLSAHNGGPSPAGGVSIEDEIPAGMSFVGASAGCSEAGGVVTCTPPGGTLADDETVEFTVTVTVEGSAAGTDVGNTAEVLTDGDPHDPDPTNNRATSTVRVAPRADLAITKTATSATPALDTDNAYNLTVTNNGPNAAENVVIEDTLPAGMTFVSASQGCVLDGTTVTCTIGTLGAGDSVTRTVTLRAGAALAGQVVNNTASVDSTTEDPDPSNNEDEESVTVGRRVDLSITKTVDPATVAAGQTATFTLTVRNDGPSPATGVILTESLPSGLELVSTAPSQGSCDRPVGNAVECNLGTIAPAGTAQVLVTARATSDAAGQSLTNTASVTSNEPEARIGDNSASSALGVTAASAPARARLSLRKVANRTRVSAGQRVTFTLRLRNLGPGTARDVTVCDRLPAGLLFVSAPGGTFRAGQVCWSFGKLRAGAQRRLKLNTRAARLPTARRVVNTGVADASNAGAVRGRDSVRVRRGQGRAGGVTG
jgi:large repetitive protein